jgi:hypothetical protein
MKELNQEYEVIPVNELEVAEDEIFVRLANGKILGAKNYPLAGEIRLFAGAVACLEYDCLEIFGIEALRVVPIKPLIFEGEYLGWDHDEVGTWILIALPDDGKDILSKIHSRDKLKFQVTQIVEETK